MPANINDYSEQAIHTSIVDYLKEDGAICSSSSKMYDINETNAGGNGARLAFKNINDRIIRYHSILEFLEGEKRANIYESIPVIDFVHKENTGFLESYYSDESGLYTKIISDIPMDAKKSDLDLIKENDPYTVNRALMGLTMSEHFYGTSGKEMSDYNLQVAYPDLNDHGYIYKGVRSYKDPPSSKESGGYSGSISSTYYTSINIWKITDNTVINFRDASSAGEIPSGSVNVDNDRNVRLKGNDYYYVYNNNDDIIVLNASESIRPNYFKDSNGANKNSYEFENTDGIRVVSHEKVDGAYCQINIQRDDLLVLIPTSQYSLDSNKFVLCKRVKIDHNFEWRYFVLFFSDAMGIPDAFHCEEVFYNDRIPFDSLGITQKSEQDTFIRIIGNFIHLEEEYYSDASGLLNGYFCEPQEIEKTIQGRKVTKWRYTKPLGSLENDSSIGRLYNGGNFLSKNTIKGEPLALTPHDKIWVDGAGTEANTKGKASLFYKNLLNGNSYLTAFQSDPSSYYYDFNNWNNSNISPLALTNVVTMTNISNRDSRYLKYRDKFDNCDSLADIKRYIEMYSTSIRVSGSDKILELNESERGVSYYNTTTQKTFWSWLVGDKKVGSGGENNRVEEYFDLLFHVNYNYERKKGKLRIKDVFTLSPYEIFLSASGASVTPTYTRIVDFEGSGIPISSLINNMGSMGAEYCKRFINTDLTGVYGIYEEKWPAAPILVYPEKEDAYPFAMILLSRQDLNLRKKDVISLWNNSAKKYLMLEVSSMDTILPSEVNKAHYMGRESDSESHLDKTVNWMFSKTRNFDVEVTYYEYDDDEYDEDDDRGSRRRRHKTTEIESRPYIGLDRSHDCYIYYLTPKELSLDALEGKFYDTHDNVINIRDKFGIEYMVPTVNSSDYFHCDMDFRGIDDIVRYTLTVNSGDSLNTLRNSSIIRGLPNLADSGGRFSINTLKNQLSRLPWGSSLRGFYSEFINSFDDKDHRERYERVFKNLYRSILGSLEISERTSDENGRPVPENIIYLRDVKGLVSNLNNIIPILKDTLSSGLSITDADGNQVILTKNDVKSLEDRSTKCSPYTRWIYNISNSYSKSRSAESIPWKFTEVQGYDDVPSQHLPYYEKVGEDSYRLVDPQPEAGDPMGTYYVRSLDKTLQALVNDGQNSVLKVSLNESFSTNRWYSFSEIISIMDRYESDGDDGLNLSCAESIDGIFGNGTYPFIRVSNEALDIPLADMDSFLDSYASKLNGIIEDVLSKYVYIYKKDGTDLYVNTLKDEYKKYFTSSSVENAVSQSGNVDIDKLSIRFGTRSNPNTNILPIYSRLTSLLNSPNGISNFISTGSGFSSIVTQAALALSIRNMDGEALRDKFGLYDGESGAVTQGTREALLKQIRNLIIEDLNKVLQVTKDSISLSGGVFNSSISSSISNLFKKLFKGLNIFKSVNKYVDIDDFKKEYVDTDNGRKFKVSFDFPEVRYDGELVPGDQGSVLFKTDYKYTKQDIAKNTFKILAKYIRYSLSGVSARDSNSSNTIYEVQGVKNVMGESPDLHPEGLYGMRYQILNGRMNRINGPLYMAAQRLIDGGFFSDCKRISDQTIDSYAMFANVLPVANMDAMTYIPTQKASLTTVDMKGKFYSDKEMESLRNTINSQCVLTCTKCAVKESCPFYDQNEVIKMACTPMETIDLYLKDNELELIDEDSIEVVELPVGGSFDVNDLKLTHMEYSEILAKKTDEMTQRYDTLNLSDLNNELIRATGLSYSDYVADDMRWLLGGRYGTVEYNGALRDLIGDNFVDMKDKISPYKYCYDALFMKIKGIDNTGKPMSQKVPYMTEDSYIGYRLSANSYPVTYEVGPVNQKKKYKVKVRLKMPAYVKMLHDAGENDDVYLVSDDVKDPNGKAIDPVIYLGKARNIQYAFDIIEDDPGTENSEREGLDLDDTNIYASDVAQWCINYMKGHCTDDPVGKTDVFSNRDQYWMNKVYKRLNIDGKEVWKEYPGRPRQATGFQEILIDPEDFDDVMAISGHPMINTYYDFIRKVSIRIYDPSIENEDDRWIIPWVNPSILPADKKSSLDDLKETQRATLPLMKTNLRLVVVKA